MFRIFSLFAFILASVTAFSQSTYEDLNERVTLLIKAGKYAEAIPYALEEKEQVRSKFGDTSENNVIPVNNLAYIYQHLKKYTEAEDLLKQSLAIRKNSFGTQHPNYATSLYNLATLYTAMGNYSAAETMYKEAIAIRKKTLGGESPKYVVSLDKLAGLYRTMGNYSASESLYLEVIAIIKKVSGRDDLSYAGSLDNLASLYRDMDKPSAALPLYKEAMAISKNKMGIEDKSYAASLNNIASTYEAMGDFTNAEPMFKEAIEVCKKTLGTETAGYATCLDNLAGLYDSMGNNTEAKSLYYKALEIRKKVLGIKSTDYARSLNNLAKLLQKMGDYTAAEPLFKEAIEIFKNVYGVGNPIYARLLNNLATFYEAIGNYTTAETLLKESLNVIRSTFGNDHPVYAKSISDLAFLYRATGSYAIAEPLYKEAISVQKNALGKQNLDYASYLEDLGLLYHLMGNYDEAIPLVKEAMSINKKIAGIESLVYAGSLTVMARINMVQNDFVDAELSYKAASVIYEKYPGPNYNRSLLNLGDLYRKMGKYKEAEPLYKKAMTVWKKDFPGDEMHYALILNNLAKLYREMGNYSASESFYKEAILIWGKVLGKEHPFYTIALINIAELYEAMGDFPAAESFIIQGSNATLTSVKNNFANLSESEKMIWWDKNNGTFVAAPSLLFMDGKASNWFRQQSCTQQLQINGIVLNDGLKILKQVRSSGNSKLIALVDKWQNYRATLSKQYSLPVKDRMTGLDSVERLSNIVEKEINNESSIFRSVKQNVQVGFKQVEEKLKNDEAAVEFVKFHYYRSKWTDSTLYAAFVILPNDTIPHFVPLCEETQLAKLLKNNKSSSKEFIDGLYGDGINPVNNKIAGSKKDSLYKLLWEPLAPFFKGINKIDIAPAGLLCRINFNALPFDSNSYLIDKYEIRQYSSVRQIAEQKQPENNLHAMDAVLYGGVDYGERDTTATGDTLKILTVSIKHSKGKIWGQLSSTLDQVNEINDLFKLNGKTTVKLTGTAASEESLKILSGNSPRILHIATHGFSKPNLKQEKNWDLSQIVNQFSIDDDPMFRNGLIMATANRVWSGGLPVEGREDGIVTAYEISNLDLTNTELVVLSACETALGDIRGTEGVFGMQRAFKLAGVQDMLLGLWNLPLDGTSQLMKAFYTNKLNNKMPTYQAFRAAQGALRKNNPPYKWAGMVLIE